MTDLMTDLASPPGSLAMRTPGVLDALATLEAQGIRSVAEVTNPFRLRYYPDPLLWVPALAVDGKEELSLQVVDAMRRALRDKNGRGIAATHVGGRQALAILPIHGTRTLVLNPEMTGHGRSRTVEQEGSLSTPGFHWQAERWQWIRLAYLDEYRKRHTVRLEDEEARVAQHLLDALAGHPVPENLTRQQRRDAERRAAKAEGRR